MSPWEVDRLNPAEMEVMFEARRRDRDFAARLVAWAVLQMPAQVAQGVARGVSVAFGGKPLKPPQPRDVIRSAPGYDREFD